MTETIRRAERVRDFFLANPDLGIGDAGYVAVKLAYLDSDEACQTEIFTLVEAGNLVGRKVCHYMRGFRQCKNLYWEILGWPEPSKDKVGIHLEVKYRKAYSPK